MTLDSSAALFCQERHAASCLLQTSHIPQSDMSLQPLYKAKGPSCMKRKLHNTKLGHMCRCATGEAAGGVLPQHRPAEYVRAGPHPPAAPLHLAEPAAAGAARQPAQLPGGPRALHHWGPG